MKPAIVTLFLLLAVSVAAMPTASAGHCEQWNEPWETTCRVEHIVYILIPAMEGTLQAVEDSLCQVDVCL